MVNEDFGRESFQDPSVPESLIRAHSCKRIPVKASSHKINKRVIIGLENVTKILAPRYPYMMFPIWHQNGCVIVIEKLFSSLTRLQNLSGGLITYFHHHSELFHLVFAWEQGIPDAELSHDAAETPHVNGCRVRNAKDDLGGTVKSRLNVSVNTFIREARAAKVDDLDTWLCWILK